MSVITISISSADSILPLSKIPLWQVLVLSYGIYGSPVYPFLSLMSCIRIFISSAFSPLVISFRRLSLLASSSCHGPIGNMQLHMTSGYDDDRSALTTWSSIFPA